MIFNCFYGSNRLMRICITEMGKNTWRLVRLYP
nr:MAG TPA: hypothetical protein [Caudoviricetes sp.]